MPFMFLQMLSSIWHTKRKSCLYTYLSPPPPPTHRKNPEHWVGPRLGLDAIKKESDPPPAVAAHLCASASLYIDNTIDASSASSFHQHSSDSTSQM
jgi:hypothetical protein